MKRKIFSSLLLGALAFASLGTVTSCKDYDDDINNLQDQINKAALSSDVETLKTQLETASSTASSAATTAEEALTQANANATDIASVKATAEAAATDVATALTNAANAAASASEAAAAAQEAQDSANAAIKAAAAVDEKLESALANMGQLTQTYMTADQVKASLDSLSEVINEATTDSIAKLTKVVEGYKGGINALYSAVTEVSLVGSLNSGYGQENGNFWNNNLYLYFKTGVIPANYTFGAKEKDDLNGEHSATPQKSYVKDNTINFPEKILIRVNPVNATVTTDMIKLIDSKGNDLDDLIKVVSVERYDELLTRASATGLWTVKLQLQDGVKADDVRQEKDGNPILYAIAINNTASQAETSENAADRYVVSTYDLSIEGTNTYTGESSLGNVKVKAESKDWKTLSTLKPNGSDLVYAANGEDVLVSFENLPNVDRFYVVRDDKHAGESEASELNAWTSYTYKGLNEVVEVENGTGVGTINIKINGQVGDEVQFRIFAVNYDGTLVETTGRAFRVYVGAESTTTSVTGDLVATGKNVLETEWLAISSALKDGGTLPTSVELTVNNVKQTVNVQYAKDNKGTSASKNSEIKYAKFTLASDATKWTDGATATGTIKDSENLTVNTISVSLTKVMPTADYTKTLMNYSWKDNQLSNGIYTAYLYPTGDVWTTEVNSGYKDMNNAINGLATNFVISIANADVKTENGKNYYKNPLKVTAAPWTVTVSKEKDAAGTELIDNETQHETTIGYNYGQISSADPNNDYVVNVETVQTVFACPLNTTAQTYSWSQRRTGAGTTASPYVYTDVNVLTYGSTTTVVTNIFDYLTGKNSFDNTVFGGALSSVYNKYVSIEAKLISNGSKLEDYYKATVSGGTITFTSQSGTTNPTDDVASTLVLTMKDAFGHENVYELPFTVKRAK